MTIENYNQTDSIKPSIEDFVAEKWGDKAHQYLNKISTGGISNQKGADYEHQFIIFKTFEIGANNKGNLEKHFILSQSKGFVDDVVHVDGRNNIRTNYQAKNASGGVANWSDEISKRMRMQYVIDKDYHEADESYQCLLVSCESTAQRNQSKIPSDIKRYANCEFFPYVREGGFISLVEHGQMREHVTSLLINNSDDSDIYYALKLISGSITELANKKVSVREIFENAKSSSNPSIFCLHEQMVAMEHIPKWLIEASSRFNVQLEILSPDYLSFTTNGLIIRVPLIGLQEAPKEPIQTVRDFVQLLMQKMAEELQEV